MINYADASEVYQQMKNFSRSDWAKILPQDKILISFSISASSK